MIVIREGALFISDAHENATRDGFYRFLRSLEKGTIKTPQLFLMGDMFDLLVGEIDYTMTHYQKSIDLINKVSHSVEIIYFEGNHDFNLQTLFPDVTVIPLSRQPALCTFANHTLLLSHGDAFEGTAYLLFSKIIRNHTLLSLLNLLDHALHHIISKNIFSKQQKKSICREQSSFYHYIKQKTQKYDIGISKIDFVCEGHHHQNKEFVFDTFLYKNFSSFACDHSYFQISFTDKIIFKELQGR